MTRETASSKVYPWAGWGLIIGASVGGIVGLLLFENLALGAAFGTGLGLIAGAALAAYSQARVVDNGELGR